MRRLTCFALFAVLLLALVSASAAAGESATKPAPSDDNKAPTVKLVLHPAPAPRPALKYQLLPRLVDRRPGNAAVLYNQAPAEQTALLMEFGKRWPKIEKWQQVPLGDPREKELRKEWQSGFQLDGSMLATVARGARCESCDWQLPIREEDFYSILLPQFQQTRTYARLLRAEARIQIAEGRFDEAIHTLQTGYALARHVAQAPCLVTSLVGLANAEIMSKGVEDWVQQRGAPNLYWALTWLPRPLIDSRPGLEGEMDSIYFYSCRNLRDLDRAKHSPEEWQKLLEKTVDEVRRWNDAFEGAGKSRLSAAAALRGYPMAKQGLVTEGRPAAEVEAMPPAQAVLLYSMHTYENLRDNIFKWLAVPCPEGRAGAAEAQKNLREAVAQGREILPIAAVILPMGENMQIASPRADRTITILRTIEAIRLYGASHEGRLPANLAEIKEVPVPADPITGQPFVYQLSGTTAILESPPISGRPQKQFGLRYEIRFATSGK